MAAPDVEPGAASHVDASTDLGAPAADGVARGREQARAFDLRFGWRQLLSPRHGLAAVRHALRLAWRSRFSRALLVVLLLLDAALMLLHWYVQLGIEPRLRLGWLNVAQLDMIRHESYVTAADQTKAVAAVLFLVVAALASRVAAYAYAALAYLVILVFTTTTLHVGLSEWLADITGLAARYPEMGSHMMEAVILGAAGLAMLALIALGALRAHGIHSIHLLAIAAAIVALGIFAGGVDLFHALIFYDLPNQLGIISFVEEAGEAVSLTVGCVFAAAIALRCLARPARPQPSPEAG